MPRLVQGMLLAVLFATVVLAAEDDPPKGEPAKSGSVAAPMVAQFHDGTTIRRVSFAHDLTMETRFGKLTVPMHEVRRIEFGFRLSPETARKIDDAIRLLGSSSFVQRESASKLLVELGFQAYPALQEAAKNKDQEVARRAQTAVKQIEGSVPPEKLRFKTQDVVYTNDSVLSGRITETLVQARTEYFGPMQFKLADLHFLRSMASSEVQVTADAARFGPDPGYWLDTGVLVEDGAGLVVTASGQVELNRPQMAGVQFGFQGGVPQGAVPQGAAPQAVGKEAVGPEGSSNSGSGLGGFGLLLGRIGESGPVFAIGKHFENRVSQGGKLYVRVNLTRTIAATGMYELKISSGPEVALLKSGTNPGGGEPVPAGGFGPGLKGKAKKGRGGPDNPG